MRSKLDMVDWGSRVSTHSTESVEWMGHPGFWPSKWFHIPGLGTETWGTLIYKY